MNDALATLLAAAIQAPSGDNTQPWHFLCDAAKGRVVLAVDETRDPSPMNSGQRMARIAVGAALENLIRTARCNNWSLELNWQSSPTTVEVLLGSGFEQVRVEPVIKDRATNRRIYDAGEVPEAIRTRLGGALPADDSIRIHWLFDRARLPALAGLIGRTDAMMFGEPTMRRAFFSKVRFDEAPSVIVAEGLSLASLELSRSDRLALRTLRRLPNWLVKYGGALGVFAKKARSLVASASGLCLVTARDNSERGDVYVGQTMQRAWLALTAEKLAAQPMMSLPVLENALDHGTAELLTSLGRAKVMALCDEVRALVPEIGSDRPAFLLRFGFAPAPSGRTGRLPVAALCTESPPEK